MAPLFSQVQILLPTPFFHFWGVAKSVRHRTLTPVCVGSSPATPAIYGPLAQSVEHLTFNQGVPRSSRGWITRKTAPVRKNRSFLFYEIRGFFAFLHCIIIYAGGLICFLYIYIDRTYVLCYNLNIGTTILGRRLSDSRSTENSVFIETSQEESFFERRTFVVLTLSDFIAILSLCITCFSLGYAIGRCSKTKR